MDEVDLEISQIDSMVTKLEDEAYRLTKMDIDQLYMIKQSLSEIIDYEKFPKEKFIRYTLKRFRLIISQKIPNKYSDNNNGIEDAVLYSLISAFGKHAQVAEDELLLYLDSGLPWLVRTGFELLDEISSPPRNKYLSKIFSEMSKNGVNCYPYTTGELLKSYLTKDSYLYERIIKDYKTETNNYKSAMLQTFSMIENLPIEVEDLILNEFNSDGMYDMAVIAACRCLSKRDIAIKQLFSALNHNDCTIRGNAAISLAILKADDSDILMKLGEMLDDMESNGDCTVQDSVIEAIGIYGQSSLHILPKLLKLLEKELLDNAEEISGYPVVKNEICWALEKIESNSNEVINLLIEVVKQGKWISTPQAIMTLSKFGTKSKDVLMHLTKYINGDDYLDHSKSEYILMEALHKIGGINHPLLKQYIKRLLSSEFEDYQESAKKFLYTNKEEIDDDYMIN